MAEEPTIRFTHRLVPIASGDDLSALTPAQLVAMGEILQAGLDQAFMDIGMGIIEAEYRDVTRRGLPAPEA